MGLFYHEFEHQYTQRGTSFWACEGKVKCQCSIKGTFSERDPTGVVNSIELNSNDEKIYFYQNQTMKSLELNLTVLEQQFYYNDQQRVYEIKLKRNNLLTVIFTEDYATFVNFYKHLAKYTILKCFEKHYSIVKEIGHGCTSKVYIGKNILSKQEVALKVFEKRCIKESQDWVMVIMNEILNLEKLRKFKLSPLIGVYETDDCIVIVMQKAGAGNMREYLQQHVADYDEELIKNIIWKVILSLKQLHCAGFIHKDIKPDNILFNNFNSNSGLFLSDFGASIMKKDAVGSRIGQICSGTLGFIAPEIIKHNTYDEKCDLFSVGSLFYFLMKGEPLFSGMPVNEIYETVEDNLLIEQKVRCLALLSEQGKLLMLKLLKVDPDERISAAEASTSSFFGNVRPHSICVGQENYSLEEYIRNRVNRYFQ